MSLLDELNDAELVITDEESGLLFVWYGSAGVQILNEAGDVLDAFSISDAFTRKLTVTEVRRAIAAYRADMFADEENES